jgi:hypothetical protein
MRRTIPVVAAATASLVLGLGAGFAAASATSAAAPVAPTTLSAAMPTEALASGDAHPMDDRMSSMMAGDAAAMDAMHASMRDRMPEEWRAACDEAHAAMTASGAEGTDLPAGHDSHHADR